MFIFFNRCPAYAGHLLKKINIKNTVTENRALVLMTSSQTRALLRGSVLIFLVLIFVNFGYLFISI